MLGAVIIVVGVGIFGTFTGYLANLFLAPKPRRRRSEVGPVARTTRERVAHLRELLAQQQAAIDELDALLAERLRRRRLSRRSGAGFGRLGAGPATGDPSALECAQLFALRSESMLSSTSATQTMPNPTQSRALTCSPSTSTADEQLQHRGDELDEARPSPAAGAVRRPRRAAAAPP